MVTEPLSASSALGVGPRSTINEARRRHQEIARAEFRKQRKRLGVLSAEQETAIEALLISAVNKISHRIVQITCLMKPSAHQFFASQEDCQ